MNYSQYLNFEAETPVGRSMDILEYSNRRTDVQIRLSVRVKKFADDQKLELSKIPRHCFVTEFRELGFALKRSSVYSACHQIY